MKQNTEEAHEAVPILCQDTPPVVFYPDEPALSHSVPTSGDEWPDLPACAETPHASQVLTETAVPDTATPVAVKGGKINSNRARPTDGQITSPRPPDNPDSVVTPADSFGGSNGDSEYVKSTKNSPLRSVNTTDLAVNISKLEMMHKVS